MRRLRGSVAGAFGILQGDAEVLSRNLDEEAMKAGKEKSFRLLSC